MLERRATLALCSAFLLAVACGDATSKGSSQTQSGDDPQGGDPATDGTGNGNNPSSSTGGAPKPGSSTTGGNATGGTAGSTTGTTGSTNPGDQTVPTGPTTTAVNAANGTVTFDLASALPALTGAKLTATVALPTTGTALTLSDLRVATGATSGLLMYRAVVVVTAGGKETQTQIGNNLNMQIPANRVAPIPITAAVGEGWATGATIKIRFSALQTATPSAIVGLPLYRECKSTPSFSAWAKDGLLCSNCHAIDLRFYTVDDKTACGQNLWIIDPSVRPAGSLLTPPNLTPPASHTGARQPAGDYGSTLAAWRSAEGV